MQIQVIQNVLKSNQDVAADNRRRLRQAAVACVNLIGSPGCGKTLLLERTLAQLDSRLRVAVLAGDLTTTRDAQRLAARCRLVRQINTGKGCHLNASQVREAIDSLPLDCLDLLLIENVGNLICPVGMDLGQDATVGMFSITEGDDKPAKHPYIVLEADVVLLNKVDLLPHVPFDLAAFQHDLRRIRQELPLIELSALTGQGSDQWLGWLEAQARSKTSRGGRSSG